MPARKAISPTAESIVSKLLFKAFVILNFSFLSASVSYLKSFRFSVVFDIFFTPFLKIQTYL